MIRRKRTDLKAVARQKKGALNSKADQITDPLFREDEFFDPEDLVQVKYEMLRRVHKDGKSVTRTAAAFAMSRVSFYEAQAALKRDGLPGLMSKKPGPHGGHKITQEIQGYIDNVASREPFPDAIDILAMVKERFDVIVHPRTIERALNRMKKKDADFPNPEFPVPRQSWLALRSLACIQESEPGEKFADSLGNGRLDGRVVGIFRIFRPVCRNLGAER